MARGIDRSSFEDSLRCRAQERRSDNIAGLFMDRWAATVLRRRRSPIALRPARRCVHYWIDVICSRWNCPSRGTETKRREGKKKNRFRRFVRHAPMRNSQRAQANVKMFLQRENVIYVQLILSASHHLYLFSLKQRENPSICRLKHPGNKYPIWKIIEMQL